jgi:hypothetical protein
MAVLGPEQWSSNGNDYQILQSYYIVRGRNSVAYIMEYPVADEALFGITDEGAMRVAFPLMVHAYQTGAYLREHFPSVRGTEPARTYIGVELVGRVGGNKSRFRVVRSIGEIVGQLNQNGRSN